MMAITPPDCARASSALWWKSQAAALVHYSRPGRPVPRWCHVDWPCRFVPVSWTYRWVSTGWHSSQSRRSRILVAIGPHFPQKRFTLRFSALQGLLNRTGGVSIPHENAQCSAITVSFRIKQTHVSSLVTIPTHNWIFRPTLLGAGGGGGGSGGGGLQVRVPTFNFLQNWVTK